MLFFIDESGLDRKLAPYEVLAGISVRERDLWNLIQAIRRLEIDHFGLTLSSVGSELKGKKLLKNKTFRLANLGQKIDLSVRSGLVKSFLEKGAREAGGGPKEARTLNEYASYGQAILDFVSALFEVGAKYQVRTFASMVSKTAPRPSNDSFLRKDYAYLFERFYYYLEDLNNTEMGLIVFDELEKAQSHILLNQMERYFKSPGKGSMRSSRIVPEPFFVHSDLTTMVQFVDIVAYCLNWGARINRGMTEPNRKEMRTYSDTILDMQYRGKKTDQANHREWDVYGVIYLDDLRPRDERLGE